MRHKKTGVKLGRTTSHRDAMFRNMVTSLLKYDRIHTTDVKAKELRRWVDKIITLAKRGDLHARRQALAIVREKDVVHKLFDEAQKRFGSINGGYSRIVKIGRRPGDAAPMSLIELISSDEKAAKSKKRKAKASKKASPAKSAVKPKTADAAVPVGETTETESLEADSSDTAATEEAAVDDAQAAAPQAPASEADVPPAVDKETDSEKK